ncbi:MAG: hypothetical protein OHK0046_34150 [Anaerolineae bacterium]
MNQVMVMAVCCLVGVLFLVSHLWFFLRVLRPLRQLALQAESLTEGHFNSFDQACGGISEIQKLQRAMSGMVGHVRRAQEQRRAYTEQLADGQENERKRIARELHDDTIQAIIAVTQSMDMARTWINTDPEQAVQTLRAARAQAVEVVANLRNLIGGLRPPALEELGLIPALEMQLEGLREVAAHLKTEGEPRRLPENQELALFRTVQEALSNVTRHSAAHHVYVEVNYTPEGVLLTVRDDGQGFLPPTHLGDLAFENHYGLLGIQERISNLGGWLNLTSQIARGTTLQAYVPSGAQAQPDNLVRDPVCSALIESQQAYGSLQHAGTTYYFCCPVCQGAFQKDPDLYLDTRKTPL